LSHLDKNIIAVGTTSLRTLESLYWLGVKQSTVDSQQSMEITQWEVYEHKEKMISTKEALENLIQWMNEKGLNNLTAKTQIIIAPGYQFKIVNGLITNFHQPQSTLLYLVAAFIRKRLERSLQICFENNFRFLSYGDGSLLRRKSLIPF
jgi:S-adenosylmethionine:tRNA ribosyltransferase-isomerase